MSIIKKKAPKNSLFFTEDIEHQLEFADVQEGKPAQLAITPLYSGKPVTHWWFGKVSIDLESMTFSGSKFPVLRDHDTSRIVGFSKKPKIVDIDGKLSLHVPDITTVGTQFANEILDLGKQGFPFQASVSVKPSRIEQIKEGATVVVNGYDVKGPAVVLRGNTYNEGSVCVFGVDRNTSLRVFSENEIADIPQIELDYEQEGPEQQPQPEEGQMTFDPSKYKDDAEFAAFVSKTASDAVAPIQAQLSEATATIAARDARITELTDAGQASDNRLKALEKTVARFSEQALSAQASSIVSKLIDAAKFSDRQASKVRPTLPGYDAFVKDDVLDTAAFSEAVTKEIAEWKETFGASTPDSEILGNGSMPAGAGFNVGGASGQFSADSIVSRMSNYMGAGSGDSASE